MKYFIFLVGFTFMFSQQKQDHIITYGSTAKSAGTSYKTAATVGQPAVGSYSGVENSGSAGFWSFFLLEPQPPIFEVSEGDFPDRIEVKWDVDILSPIASEGFKIYRDGNLIGRADATAGSFTDFDVVPGELYNYEVTGLNQYGEGNSFKIVGFVNPNGIITGSVNTSSGQPSRNVEVTVSPNLGKSLDFSNLQSYSFNMDSSLKEINDFSISLWLKHNGNLAEQNIIRINDNFSIRLNNKILEIHGSELIDTISMATMSNEWHTITGTYTDSNTTFRLYFDGKIVSEKTVSQIDLPANLGQFILGDGVYSGLLDNVSFWSKALSNETIRLYKNLTFSANSDNLIAYYKFDEGQGNKLYDLTEDSHDLKQNGITWSNDIAPVKVGGITDQNGNYIIEGINYGAGITFEVSANKKTPLGNSILLQAWTAENPDEIQINVQQDVDFINGPYTIERWVKQNAGEWTHFAYTFDGSNTTYYVDGFASGLNVANEILTFGLDTVYSSDLDKLDSIVSIGNTLTIKNSEETFYDEVRIWSDVRTPAEIQYNHDKLLNDGEENLVLYLNLNEGGGSVTKSKVGNRYLAFLNDEPEWSEDIPLDEFFDHLFSPSIRNVTLNTSNTATDGITFNDISVMKVSGYINYINTDCYQDSIQFLVNGNNEYDNVVTDKNGFFELELPPGGTYKIEPYYKKNGQDTDHTFRNKKSGQSFIIVGPLFNPIAGIEFENTRTRELNVNIFGGYDLDDKRVNIGEFNINIRSKDGCYEKNFLVTEIVNNLVELPPLDLIIAPAPTSNNTDYFVDVKFDGLSRDLELKNDTTHYQYNSDMTVTLNVSEFYNPFGDVYIVNQYGNYHYDVNAFEAYRDVKNAEDVEILIPSAIVNIYDDISGTTSSNLELKDGIIENLVMIPGYPNITSGGENPYQKKLEAVVVRDNGQSRSALVWAYIEGLLPKGNTFTSISPLTPFMILHDPPGDGSSASLEKGKSYSTSYSFSDTRGSYFNASLGVGFHTGLQSFIGLGAGVNNDLVAISLNLAAEVSMSQSTTNGAAYDLSISFTEEISTSDDPSMVGPEADIFIGYAQNFIYGKADSLKINIDIPGETVTPTIKEKITFQPGEIETMYVYSRKHITDVMIPELQSLAVNSDTPESKKDSVLNAIKNWKSFLVFNQENMDKSVDPVSAVALQQDQTFRTKLKTVVEELSEIDRQISITGLSQSAKLNKLQQDYRSKYIEYDLLLSQTRLAKNISFDAGTSYSYSTSENFSSAKLWSTESEFSGGGSIGFELDAIVSATIEISFGGNMVKEYAQETSTEIGHTFNYSLVDDDIGDYYSVSIKEDPIFGSPVFELYSGTSMGPWNEGTKARVGVDFSITNSEILNIDPAGKGSTKILVSNVSPTNEEQTYRLMVDQASNPDGAIIAVNGVIIEQFIDITIAANTSHNLTLTVERGPIAYSYEDLKLIFFAPDENEEQTYSTNFNEADSTYIRTNENLNYFTKEVTFDAHFLEPVSEISLFEPQDNWLVNSSNNDTLWMTITDYDTTKTIFEKVKIQYRNHISSVGKSFEANELINSSKSDPNPWIIFTEIGRDSLTRNGKAFLRFPFMTTGFADGVYEVRAVTVSSNPDVLDGSSQILKGVVDVNGPVILGVPDPVDGVLHANDEVRMRFNEDINVNALTPSKITVIQTATGDNVNYYLAKSEREIVFTFDMNSNLHIENKQLRITIADLEDSHGNVYRHPVNHGNEIEFEFLVDRNPIKWVGGDINEVKYSDEAVEFTRQITNTGDIRQFTLENIPSWLDVSPRSATLNKDDFVTITFKMSSDLVLGAFEHTIFANTNMGNEALKIDFRNLMKAPEWTVTPENYQYSMNMVAELFIDSISTTDVYDKIAIFVNDELTGVGEIEQIDETRYRSYINIYSNTASSTNVSALIWDSSTGRTLKQNTVPFNFQNNQLLGTSANPFQINTSTDLLHKYSFKKGWNWFSLNLKGKEKVNDVLSSIKTNIDILKSHTAFLQNDESFGFVGSLDSVNTRTTYFIKVKDDAELNYSGKPLVLNQNSQAVKVGWTPISYLPIESEPVDAALQSLLKQEGDIIKSQKEFAVFDSDLNKWTGTLKYMNPGVGYYLKVANAGSLVYPSPESTREKGSEEMPVFPAWEMKEVDFEHSMSVIAEVDASALDFETLDKVSLSAFSGDEIRGSVRAILSEKSNKYLFYLTVFGTKGVEDKLHFRVMNEAKQVGYELEETILFQEDQLLGGLNNPIRVGIIKSKLNEDGQIPREYKLDQNYPNPFNPVTTIKYSLKERTNVTLVVFNALGKKVRTLVNTIQDSGDQSVTWNGLNDKGVKVSSGIYFYQLHAGQFKQTNKMVLIK